VEVPLEQQGGADINCPNNKSKAYFNAARSRGFNLSKPLMRLALFQMDEDIYQFIWTHHHILMGWCGPWLSRNSFPLPSVQQRSRFTTGTNLFLQKLHSLAEKAGSIPIGGVLAENAKGFKPTPLGIKQNPVVF